MGPIGYREYVHEHRGTAWQETLETIGGDDGKSVLKFVYTGWSGDKDEHIFAKRKGPSAP